MKVRCEICRKYDGLSIEQIAAKLECSETTVINWHRKGTLTKALEGAMPKSRCKYRRLYGHSLVEIAEILQQDQSRICHLHQENKLKKILQNRKII